MILFELLVGLVLIALLAFAGIFFTKGRKRSNHPTDLTADRSVPTEERDAKPRNKANMDQPQEEFIAPESAHANAGESKK